jgi:hypothetical protein
MARSLGSSVGRLGGRNAPGDVVTVQLLLNKVPPAQGGPTPLLDVDGLNGPKTVNAIQRFQLKQFGWRGADGRVDPDGQTLAKLNEFDDLAPGGRLPLTTSSSMRCSHGGVITAAATPRALLVLTTTDKLVVAGCPFFSPCVRVQWLDPPGKPLNTSSIGLCVSAANLPQGTVMILSA